MSKRSDKLLLEDIKESIEKIGRFTAGMNYEEFIEDEKTTDAVVRNFEIIGEAANRISKEIHERYSDIEWRRIVGFRNRIVHEYFGIDYEIVWNIMESYLSQLEEKIIRALKEEGGSL